MNFRTRSFALAAAVLLVVTFSACDKPVNLKTLELDPTDIDNHAPGSKGSKGVCFSQADPPLSTFSAGSFL